MRIKLLVMLMLMPLLLLAGEEKAGKSKLTSEILSGLKFRCVGPALTSGRISDFAVNPENPAEYYVAVASGGVWKTKNAGTTYEPVFDDQNSFSIGCVTLDPNNPHTVWVGTGENNSQRSVSYGDGIYRSLDGGKSWENMGLKKSEHIAKIVVDPRNSNVVFVAAQGPLWAPGGDRGLYKSTDGGKTWRCVLKISENTGVTDLVYDPRNPDVMLAASYQRRRHVFTLINGGPESAIYKSTDGGETWRKITNGLPKVDLGRIGLAISPANPDIVYAIIEAADDAGGFFRSTDRGESWKKMSDKVARSPQYYQEIVADPRDPDRVYVLDTWTTVTEDGGKTFRRLGNSYRHVDDHALWIDPQDTRHLLIGGDGGIYESWDRGKNWEFKPNLPVTQFYRVAVDNRKPFYYIYGGTQDNFSLGGPSRTTNHDGIVNSDWFPTNGGDGFESQIDPENPDIVYAQAQYGWLVRFDKKSGEAMGIKPVEGPGEPPLRWNWDSPLLISPHSPTRLYFAANKLFRSDDRGNSWTVVSGDLTRQLDRNKLPVMGKVWSVDAVSKNKSTSYYGTIVALSESPLREGLIYVGTDDGLIQVTRDGGKTWTKIEKFPNIPEYTYVSSVLASRFDEGTVYATFDNHKNGDFKPYVLVSRDYGKSWRSIITDLPENGPVYILKEDHLAKNLLFVGTEFGVFTSVNGGKSWVQLKSGLPSIAVRDIAIQPEEDDLVLATFGRGFYILDDYSPLRQISETFLEKPAALFPIQDTPMFIETYLHTGAEGGSFYRAPNPPFGAAITFYIKEAPLSLKAERKKKEKAIEKQKKIIPFPAVKDLQREDDEIEPFLLFQIKDENGQPVRRLRTNPKAGVQRVYWDIRYDHTRPVNSEKADDLPPGMPVLPGKYSVEMLVWDDGELQPLAGPVSFTAYPLNLGSLPAVDQKELVSFQKNVAEVYRVASGLEKALYETQERVSKLRVAYLRTPELSSDIWERLVKIDYQLKNLERKLVLDKTLSKRSENQPPSVLNRIERIIDDQWLSLSAPTETQRQSLKVAVEGLKGIRAELVKIREEDLPRLEEAFEREGAPWTPGRLPDLPTGLK
ncbi:MAG: hypothetical protein Kow0037_03360 [Calditrichia bacterium]